MDKIDRLYSYYENSLDEESENLLFSELAGDVEFRAEFKAFNSITKALPAHINSFKPSDAQKNRLFAKAGYLVPLDGNVLPTDTTNIAPDKNVFNKFYQNGIVQSVVASILTVFIMLYILKDNEGGIKNNDRSESILKNYLPVIESYASDTSKNDKSEIKQKVKYVYIEKFIPIEQKYSNKVESGNALKSNSVIRNSQFEASNMNFNNLDLVNKNNYQNLSLNKSDLINYELADQNFEFVFEQSIPWHIPGETISPEVFNKFNNSAIRILYRISDNLKVGGSAEQSTFFTTYESKNSDGDLYRISMQPNLTTFSGELVYNIDDFEQFIPYIQLGLGANTAGFVIKPSVGMNLTLTDNLFLYLAGNFDYFIFSHQDNWYNSQKFRLSYGISFKL